MTRHVPVTEHDSPLEAVEAQPTPLERTVDSFCNWAIMLGCLVSGTLGGMAAMTLLHVYLFNVSDLGNHGYQFLQYYSPIALRVNRVYWILIVVALASSVSRCEACLSHVGS
jgi:hypothetical protein